MTARLIVVAVAWLAAVAGALLIFAARPAAFAGNIYSLGLSGLALTIVTNASVGAVLIINAPATSSGRSWC